MKSPLTQLLITMILSSCCLVVQAQGGQPNSVKKVEPTVVDLSSLSLSGRLNASDDDMFTTLAPLPEGKTLDDYGYIAEEYLLDGVTNQEDFQTRVVIRRPSKSSDFSGLVITEAMHPSTNAWLFYMNHRYLMTSGHIGVEILTHNIEALTNSNNDRYENIRLSENQVNQVIAMVGALLKAESQANPLFEFVKNDQLRKVVLAGTSATANILIDFLAIQDETRLTDGQSIYDGFLPTSNARDTPKIDVPMIQVVTMSELELGRLVTRQDSDNSNDQYRLYEAAGVAHLETRDIDTLKDVCLYPLSQHQMATAYSAALHHLFEWVDKGTVPPKAERIKIDRNKENDGSLLALNEYGNAQGGLPSPYVNVPFAKYAGSNKADPETKHPASRICFLAGIQYDFDSSQLKKIYGNAENYREKLNVEVDRLVSAGWLLPVDVELVLADALKVNF